MDILHSGFDKAEIAFNGALSGKLRSALEGAKERAAATMQPELISLGGVDCWVKEKGGAGGYKFVWETADGIMWALKDSDQPADWNIRAVVPAALCAIEGLEGVEAALYGHLKAWRAKVTDESIARLDYAVDFMAEGFWIDPTRIVCHSRCNVAEHESEGETDGLAVHWTNRRAQSITIGKMPGRQVIVYDKTREVRATGKGLWYELWGFCPVGASRVWRVEVRGGKDYLQRARVRTFADAYERIGTVFETALREVRLVADPNVTNISRAATDPAWSAVTERTAERLEDHAGVVSWGRYVEGRREEIAATYRKQILGCAWGYAVTLGKSAQEAVDTMADEIGEDIAFLWDGDRARVLDAFRRTRARLKFLEPAYSEPERSEPQWHAMLSGGQPVSTAGATA